MATLILIKHSLPKIVPDVPANQWRLSGEGRQRCEALADRLKAYHPDVIVTSVEPKAQETAEIVAERLGIPLETLPDLHEHDRSGVPFFTPEQFEAAVAGFFAQPARPVLGRESADQAYARFAGAIRHVIRRHPERNVAVVTHGTVMTLFVARAAGLEPYPFWKRLELPSFVVLSLPGFHVVEVVAGV